MQFCLRLNGSDNGDKIHINDVTVSGIKPGWVSITEDDFESGWGNFLESIENDSRISNHKYRSGYWSALIRDGSESSQIVTKELSVSEYTWLKI